eukprot:PhF_6_TR13524/c0_g1_i1/m.21611
MLQLFPGPPAASVGYNSVSFIRETELPHKGHHACVLDGPTLLLAGTDTFTALNLSTNTQRGSDDTTEIIAQGKFKTKRITSIVPIPIGRRDTLITTCEGGVFEASSDQSPPLSSVPQGILSAVAVGGSDTVVITTPHGDIGQLRPEGGGVPLGQGPYPGVPITLEASPCARSLSFLVGRCFNIALLFDLRSPQSATLFSQQRSNGTMTHTPSAVTAAHDASATQVLVGHSDGVLSHWDVRRSDIPLNTLPLGTPPTVVRTLPGAGGFVIGCWDGSVMVYDGDRQKGVRIDPPELEGAAIPLTLSRHPITAMGVGPQCIVAATGMPTARILAF